MTPDLLSVIVRALGFVALFQAAGAGFFLAVFGARLSRTNSSIAKLGMGAAAAGAVLIFIHLGVEAARLSGDFTGLWDPDLQHLAWTNSAAVSQIVQIGGLAVILIALWSSGPSFARWASLGALIAVGGFLITGHTRTHAPRDVLGPLLALHLLVVAFWFGSLVPLVLVIRLESQVVATAVLDRFSNLATWWVPLILIAGLTMAWLMAGSLHVLRTPYGELLLVKLGGFGLLMVLAAYNKWRLAPSFAQAPHPDSALRRSMTAEYLIMIAVLAVTAILTAFYSPE